MFLPSTWSLLTDSFTSGRLVEINSHSLFSKWFSESGKLVQKLFDAVHEMIANEEQLVVVMIGKSILLQMHILTGP
jgi:hypothetical protein